MDAGNARQDGTTRHYLLQDRGPDMTPPYSETHKPGRDRQTDRQTELEEGDTTSGSEPSTVNQTGGEEQEQLHLLK